MRRASSWRITAAGGYYIDVGGSELIASGEVKVQCGQIAEILEEGRAPDGRHVPARRSHRVSHGLSADERAGGAAHLP